MWLQCCIACFSRSLLLAVLYRLHSLRLLSALHVHGRARDTDHQQMSEKIRCAAQHWP